MIKDLIYTLKNVFGWVTTVHPIGKKFARRLLMIAAISVLFLYLISNCWAWFFLKLFVLLAIFTAFFFRNPERKTRINADEIISPADGKILSIKTEGDKDKIVIRIFLSIFDVHIQRSPVKGKITDTKYIPGSFLFANNKGADKNERNITKILTTNKKEFIVEQITGAIARRIECFVKPKETVEAGQRIGIIYFGSQVALHVPKSVKIICKEGQKVEGGLTTIGLLK